MVRDDIFCSVFIISQVFRTRMQISFGAYFRRMHDTLWAEVSTANTAISLHKAALPDKAQ